MLFSFAYFLFGLVASVGAVVVSDGATVALTSGTVTVAPSEPTEAPTTAFSLAFGPRVTVLEHADITMSNAPVLSVVTSVFFIRNLYRGSVTKKSIRAGHLLVHFKINCIKVEL